MEESDQSQPTNWASSSSTSAPESSRTGEYSGSASTSTTNSQVQEEEMADGAEAEAEAEAEVEAEAGAEENGGRYPELIQQRTRVSYNAYLTRTEIGNGNGWMRDDSWSCVVIILTFWLFVSMTMILGVYGPANLLLGPYSSILIKPNSFFVEYIKIEEIYGSIDEPMLYGFHKDPPLDVAITWSDTHNATILSYTHKQWIYFLNEGSQINVSYDVKSPSLSSLVLVIAQGNEGLYQWLADPSYPNTTLSWQVIQGSGKIQQHIYTASSYYVAVGNLNAEAVEVKLDIRLRSFLYNTTGAYNKCSITKDGCNFELSFGGGEAALLTSPGPKSGGARDEWYVKLSYGPRWVVYLAGIGGMTFLMLMAYHFLNYLQCTCLNGSRTQVGEIGYARTPLLSNKDDDLSSWGSSYDSASQDDEDPEDWHAAGSLEGKPTKDGEYNNNVRRLCAICFDAPRNCFFLPCGHCVACFACGTRIAEAGGTCPICRRHMKKVKKIFTV